MTGSGSPANDDAHGGPGQRDSPMIVTFAKLSQSAKPAAAILAQMMILSETPANMSVTFAKLTRESESIRYDNRKCQAKGQTKGCGTYIALHRLYRERWKTPGFQRSI